MPNKQKKGERMPKAELRKRAVKATARYYRQIGYEILDKSWECPEGIVDIVARGRNGELVFADVVASFGADRGFKKLCTCDADRERLESIAGRYLAEYEEVDIPVWFDAVSLMVVSDDRAFMKVYQNAFGGEVSRCGC